MKTIYTEHAQNRMLKRQLKEEWVERVIASPARIEPDDTDPDLEHRLGKIPELADRVLRVITMHLDRKMKGQL